MSPDFLSSRKTWILVEFELWTYPASKHLTIRNDALDRLSIWPLNIKKRYIYCTNIVQILKQKNQTLTRG